MKWLYCTYLPSNNMSLIALVCIWGAYQHVSHVMMVLNVRMLQDTYIYKLQQNIADFY